MGTRNSSARTDQGTTKSLVVGVVSSILGGILLFLAGFGTAKVTDRHYRINLENIENHLDVIETRVASDIDTIFVVNDVPMTVDVDDGHIFTLVYEKNAVLSGPKEGEGIILEEVGRTWLKRFKEAIVACAQGGPVKLNVKGYASSAEFRHGDGPHVHSDKMNKDAANRRAAAVIAFLVSDKPSSVVVNNTPWESYSDMAGARPVVDRSGEIAVSAREFLNRSVQIIVDDAGGCATEEHQVRTGSRPLGEASR